METKKVNIEVLVESLKEKHGRFRFRDYQYHFILEIPETEEEIKELEDAGFDYCIVKEMNGGRFWEVLYNRFPFFEIAQDKMRSWFNSWSYQHVKLQEEVELFNLEFGTNLTPKDIENELKKVEEEEDDDKICRLKVLKEIKENGDGYYDESGMLIVSDEEFQDPNFSSFSEDVYTYSVKMIYNY